MGHPSALHRPEYPHISLPFLSCPCLQQAVRKKNIHSTRGYLMLNIHTSPRMRRMLPGVNVIIAAYLHGSNERNCAYSNNSRHHNSTPKRTPVTNTYQNIRARNAIGCSVIIVTAPVAKCNQATALSQITSDTPTARNTLTLTAHEPDTLPVTVVIVTVYHRIARRINCTLSNDNDTRLPQLLL